MNKPIKIFLFVFIIVLFSSCSADREYYNWAMKNDGQKICGVKGEAGVDIGIENTSYDWGEKPMLIAIVDSEISTLSNKSLAGIIINDNSNNQGTETHALSVAGIISTCSSSEYKSVLKDAPIYSIAIDYQNINISKLIDDLRYIEDIGIRIVNMSFTMNYFCQELYDYMRSSNMLYICAVGNSHQDYIAYPANFKLGNVISVVGINNWGHCSRYSNYSINADIAAPGENVLCIVKNDTYDYLSGTSFAAPFVTACGAYLISEIDCDAFSAKRIILDCAKKSNALIGYVNEGRVLSMKNIVSFITMTNVA